MEVHIQSPELIFMFAGGTNIVAMFAQWGASQLILALILLAGDHTVPLPGASHDCRRLPRAGSAIAAGQLKPVQVAAPPPGEIGSLLLLPLSLIFFLLSIKR
jgi:hypothetical protein